MNDRLFEVELVPRCTGTTALVAIDSSVCPDCGSDLERRTVSEPVLFRHGGHGATRETVVDYCTAERIPEDSCRWSMVRSIQEVRP